jgi:transcriptional regulator with XRE-family HTH domain
MVENLGTKIRTIRNSRNLSIASFAKEIGVSVGYLSDLENSKPTVKTINLNALDKLSKYGIFEDSSSDSINNEKLKYGTNLLNDLCKTDPEAADYFLDTVIKGVHLYKKEKQ